ncbi:MAG: OB-fold domain-containing protein [Spirochaetaceae bacterium]|nr:OB-fold domain-containing protein [Spirochaetaceae bacterium]HPG28052.1 OB-fold domain-containing protein [Myxococcota bacterium]
MRPEPTIDLDNAFYWEGLRDAEIRLQRCEACGRRRTPPLPACPDCGDPRATIEPASGRGRIYSFVVAHRAFSPAFEADVPYTVAVVELEEGGRMLARLEGGDGPPRIGEAVRAAFRLRGGDADETEWTEAFFVRAPAGGDEGEPG